MFDENIMKNGSFLKNSTILVLNFYKRFLGKI